VQSIKITNIPFSQSIPFLFERLERHFLSFRICNVSSEMLALDQIVAGLIPLLFLVEQLGPLAKLFNICFAEYGALRIHRVGVFCVSRNAFSEFLTAPELKIRRIVYNLLDLKADPGSKEFHAFFCMQEKMSRGVQLNPIFPVLPPCERIRNRDSDE
jgi:hypothetical protein